MKMPTKVAVLIAPGFCKRWGAKDRGFKRNKTVSAVCTFFGALAWTYAQADPVEGDIELGAYLSAECVTCHQPNVATDGIPQITGLDSSLFVDAMLAYKSKQREHPIMQMMAGRLNDEEIAALAAYFHSLE